MKEKRYQNNYTLMLQLITNKAFSEPTPKNKTQYLNFANIRFYGPQRLHLTKLLLRELKLGSYINRILKKMY